MRNKKKKLVLKREDLKSLATEDVAKAEGAYGSMWTCFSCGGTCFMCGQTNGCGCGN
jgi:hypothetical protein